MSEETFSSLSDDPPLLSQNQTHDLTSSDSALNKIYFKVFLHLHRLAQCFASAHEYFAYAMHTFFCFTRTLIALLHYLTKTQISKIHPSIHPSIRPSINRSVPLMPVQCLCYHLKQHVGSFILCLRCYVT